MCCYVVVQDSLLYRQLGQVCWRSVWVVAKEVQGENAYSSTRAVEDMPTTHLFTVHFSSFFSDKKRKRVPQYICSK